MDTEQQIRLNFLDEAEECFDLIESNLLGLANTAVDSQKVDLMLRLAHSVKGGAGMMGFPRLSRVAHRLEDFFKILRVRYSSSLVNIEVETLLLKSLDCLRQVSNFHRQGVNIEDSWLKEHVEPIFEGLRRHLGDLQDADEDALLAQDESVDPALLMFEEGVDAVLDRFESQLSKLEIAQLSEELAATAKELVAFGQMANLEAFIELCEDIRQQAKIISQEQLESLAKGALTSWRRSHALVLRGRVEKLPSRLEGLSLIDTDISSTSTIEAPDSSKESNVLSTLEALETLDFSSEVMAEFADIGEVMEAELAASDLPEAEPDFDPLSEDLLEFEGLTELQAAFEVKTPEVSLKINNARPIQPASNSSLNSNPLSPQTSTSVGKMVRVPLEQLRQFNNLFEKLVLERNTINLRLNQLQTFTALMQRRMQQIEQSNTQLKQWYDRASLEAIVATAERSNSNSSSLTQDYETPASLATTNRKEQFDALEMDRYSDLHLICQEQIETIVQLEEVTTDIELGLQEMNQAVRDLNQTTKSLQGNVIRTQMLPFAEVVKRFPRLVRDLSLQFGKQVQLKIEGENTLIDRSVLETLSDPLIHLLRNAFDHGIETPETRIAAGKPSEGTIRLQASNQGTQTVITLSDDGAGISLEKIRDRLRAMGLPQEHIDRMSEAEILDCIFEPGFSTAERVTELSGRGVGMDVVRTNLQDIRGDVRVQTKLGLGTIFTLRIPFTLSILRVMIVEQSGIVFAVPVNSIREILRFQPEQVITTEDRQQLTWKEQTIPLVSIEKSLVFRRSSNTFNLTGSPVVERSMALVVADGTKFAGLHINRFWGEQEATIRPIESPIPLPPGFISSMVLGDGRVIPLVDPIALAQHCLKHNLTRDKAEVDSAERDSQPLRFQVQTKTILVVDDSINVRRYLGLTLEKAGYKVEQAKDGREAVDKLLGGLSVQAIICDIEMPRLDGYGVLEELKGRAQFQALPIAMLTSRSNEKHRKLAMNLGASAYFSKPYNEQELLQKLAELLG
jgi:chemosensory pili system protein ChpA (sensor histidine kinase/response regulator)